MVNEKLDAAIACAGRGWHVLPVQAKGKKPLIREWQHEATTNETTIRQWWSKWPDANIGVACHPSGLVVIDLDVKGKADGIESWNMLKRKHDFADDTVTSLTPSGGKHLFYLASGRRVRNSVEKLGPGIDVRATGGFVIVPPSTLRDVGKYRWDPSAHPDTREPAPLPPSLAKLLMEESTGPSRWTASTDNDPIPEGQRNQTLTSQAGRMRKHGVTEGGIRKALLEINNRRCKPPLDQKEVEGIAKSIARYEPGPGPRVEAASLGTNVLDTLLNNAVAADTMDERARALQALADALADAPPLLQEAYVDKVKNEGLATKLASRKEIKMAQKSRDTSPVSQQVPMQQANLLRIDTGDRDLPNTTDQVWSAIKAANESKETLFRFAGVPARIEHDDEGRPTVRTLDECQMRYHIARVAVFVRRPRNKGGANSAEVPDYPPIEVVRDVLATPDAPLPVLVGLAQTPIFSPSGRLLNKPGYDSEAKIYYAPAENLSIPEVPPNPTEQDLEEAKGLLYDLLADFPFKSDADRAHAIACFLLLFARLLIPGPTPFHLVEKPSPGTGGTLLVQCLTYPAIGQSIGGQTEGRSEEECRKRLTASLMAAPPVIFFDNLQLKVDSGALSSAITASYWEDRILGQSRIVRVPVRCVWVATGNNPVLSNEVARRTVSIRLDAQQDRPWLKREFRIPNLPKWVEEHREQLIWAALTIIQNWIAKEA